MKDSALFKIGATGAVISALCCFTPLLAMLLGATGLAGAIVWIDVVALPLLAIFMGILAIAIYRLQFR